MGKRILIISYYFAPQNAIGAVRPTKLAKYLARMGHEVTVLCGPGMNGRRDPTLERDLRELKDVRVIREWNPLRAYKAKKTARSAASGPSAQARQGSPRSSGLKRRVADTAYLYLWWRADRSFCHRAIAELGSLKGTYDMVFSTYAPFSVHEIAREAKRRGLAKRWIADFRDEVNLSFRWQAGRKARYLRMLRREADVLCAVSDGFLEMMGFEDVGRVLSNGYDREDLSPAGGKARTDGALRVVYCGTLLEGRRNVAERDVTPMLRALAALIAQGRLDAKALKLVYAGGEGALFRRYAASCGLEACVEDHGLVSREASIALQRGADILLMASWHMASQRGILTGKLFEYMMMEKPIVCCMSGDLPGSGVKKVLAQTGLGLCVEQAAGPDGEEELRRYLATLVDRWRQEKPLLSSKQADEVEAFAYPALAAVLAGWMEG